MNEVFPSLMLIHLKPFTPCIGLTKMSSCLSILLIILLCQYIVYISVSIQIYCLVLFSVLAHVVIKVQVYNYVSLLIIFFACINLQLLRLSFTTLDTTPPPPLQLICSFIYGVFLTDI